MRKQGKIPKDKTRPFSPKGYAKEELINALVKKPLNSVEVLRSKTEKLLAYSTF